MVILFKRRSCLLVSRQSSSGQLEFSDRGYNECTLPKRVQEPTKPVLVKGTEIGKRVFEKYKIKVNTN